MAEDTQQGQSDISIGASPDVAPAAVPPPLGGQTAPAQSPPPPAAPVSSAPVTSDVSAATADRPPVANAHLAGPPTEPAPSAGGPTDALEPVPGQTATTQPPQVTGGAPLVNPDAPAAGAPGPEDAMDPYVEKAGDYSGRVDDAIHLHFAELPADQQTVDGPRTAPVAQNPLAEEHLASLPDVPATSEEDPAVSAARERAQADVQSGARVATEQGE